MNTNFLLTSEFQFDILRLPNASFFIKSVDFPSVSSTPAKVATPFSTIPFAGDHGEYGPLTITCFLNEDMTSYKDIYSWWKAIHFPNTYDEYKVLSAVPGSKDRVYSDATLSFLDQSKTVVKNKVIFKDLYPTAISGFSMTYENSDAVQITFSTSFAYQSFDFG